MRVAPVRADRLIRTEPPAIERHCPKLRCAPRPTSPGWLRRSRLDDAERGVPHACYAASATQFCRTGAAERDSSAGGLLRVILALIVVLAAVLAAAWLARRMRAFQRRRRERQPGNAGAVTPRCPRARSAGASRRLPGTDGAGTGQTFARCTYWVRRLCRLAEAAASADTAAPASDPAARPTFKACCCGVWAMSARLRALTLQCCCCCLCRRSSRQRRRQRRPVPR